MKNSIRNLIFLFMLLALYPARASWAQIAPPNESGVSMGHLHFHVKDVDAYRKMFITMGGVPISLHDGIEFPGVIILINPGEPTANQAETVVLHVGFMTADPQASLTKWSAAGYKIEIGGPGQGFIHAPDDMMKFEILQDKNQTVPIVFHHVHYMVPDTAQGDATKDIQAWYVKVFGAKAGMRAKFNTADIPGVNLTFSPSKTPTVPTAGHPLDHIGFEVANLQAFCEKKKAEGVKFDSPSCAPIPGKIFNLFLTDPWGTKIELTSDLHGQ
jgi:catechol 2,3-dioxygenase-like lactoylglutathione lyase family enzyme